MDRRGHYLKPGVRATAPGILFAIGLTPSVRSVGADESNAWYEWGGADVVRSRYRKGHWSRETHVRCETSDELHRWLETNCDPRARNYVICPEGQEVAAQTRLWDWIDRGRVSPAKPGRILGYKKDTLKDPELTVLRRVALSPTCFILDYTRQGIRWTWVGGRQFFPQPEAELAKVTGEPWCTGPDADAPSSTTVRAPKARAMLWLHALQHLSTWWRENAKAPFGLTASALSVGMLRTHVSPGSLCTHSHKKSLPLEREACFGGMARTWYFGDVQAQHGFAPRPTWAPPATRYGSIEGPIYHVDVRSMYPFLLREMSFPAKHYSYKWEMPAHKVQQYADAMGVIARVTIETDRAEYPERVGRRIYYRTGRFTTTLTGPELLALRGHGRVLHVHEATLYVMGQPFAAAAAKLISMREGARHDGNTAWEACVKSITNGLHGKFAQRRGVWELREDKAAKERYGEWYEMSASGRGSARFRGVAGITYEWTPDPLGAGPYTAAFAYLAAYCRLFMRKVRDVCPERSVVSMDTDGMWCLKPALDVLEIAPTEGAKAGQLVVKGTPAEYARFLGPRHYCTDAGWVLSGFNSMPTTWAGGTITDTQRFTPVGARCGMAPRGTSVRQRVSALKVESYGLKVGKDGWGTPTHHT